MPSSMTGFGCATYRESGIGVAVELKAVNNRYFKLSLRMTDGFAALEAKIEPLIRTAIERGTVNATIRIRREKTDTDFKISQVALNSYFEQLLRLGRELGLDETTARPRPDRLVTLPGVVETDVERQGDDDEIVWGVLEKAVRQALQQMQEMRQTEGESMARDLQSNIESLKTLVGQVERRAPEVAPAYRQRLTDRIEKVMSEQGHSLTEADLIREVALFADRCDISEETVRFRSHLEQFEAALAGRESCGKKLDFLTQELFRETNTMGSKANDAEITHAVVEMKTVIERIREMVQNVE